MIIPQMLNTEGAIHSFYTLMELDLRAAENPKSGFSVSREFRSYAERLAHHMFDYLALATMGEARHANEHCETIISQFAISSTRNSGRDHIYDMADMVDPIGSAPALIEVFDDHWKASSFGGKSWKRLVECYLKYNELSPVCFVDLVVNKQHNSGTVFNKPTIFSDVSTDRLQNFLDFRRENNVLIFDRLKLFPFVIDAVKRAREAGLVAERLMITEVDVRWPGFVEWGFIKLTTEYNELRSICPACGEYEDECECHTCPHCGCKDDYCYCDKCHSCGLVEEECGCDEFIDDEKYQEMIEAKKGENLPYGTYETYVTTVGNMQLSRPV